MMDYLKKYNLSDEQIYNIEQNFKERKINYDIFKYDPEEIEKILNLFTSIGVNNIYGIIFYNPYMFHDTVSSINNRIERYKDKKELARLLNEDSSNLKLIGLANSEFD